MGNFFTDIDGATLFRPEDINPRLAGLDRAISYQKSAIVHADGSVSYTASTGVLAWGATIRIIFNDASGNLIQNTIAAGNITVADNQMVYVDLQGTNGAALTPAVATLTPGAASNTLAFNRVVLAYRNAASSKLYRVAFKPAMEVAGDMMKSIYDTDGDGVVDTAETANSVEWVNVASKPENLTDIAGLTLTGNGGKVVLVNEAGDALILGSLAAGATEFIDLTDAPNSYTGNGGKFLAVKGDASGLEFVTGSGGGATNLDDLTDVDLTTAPTNGQTLVYDSASGTFKAGTISGGTGTASFAAVATIATMIGGY